MMNYLGPYVIDEGRDQPVAFIMMGAPGSGKSTWIRNNTPGFAKWVDTDEINFREFGASPEKYMGTLARASKVAFNRYYKYLKMGKSPILDGTGSHVQKMKDAQEAAQAAGYKTYLVYIDVPLEKALENNEKRAESGGRKVHPKAIESVWNKIQDSFKEAKKLDWDKVFHVKQGKIVE
jgi:predicted kinase